MDKELQRAITLTELAPRPYFSIINVHLVDINVLPNFMKFCHSLFKILKNKHVADGQHENSIHPHKHSLQGYKQITVTYCFRAKAALH